MEVRSGHSALPPEHAPPRDAERRGAPAGPENSEAISCRNVTHARRAEIGAPQENRIRYARTANTGQWLHALRDGVVAAILRSLEDGRDRVVLAWPAVPDNGFVAAAIALREARASGRLGQAALGLWPWRAGATHAARSILVHPQDIAAAAARAAVEVRGGAKWADPRFAHEALSLVELRLNDLVLLDRKREGRPPGTAEPAKGVVVIRSPTLLETTLTFTPSVDPFGPEYAHDADQLLKRVRNSTHLGDRRSTMGGRLAALGDPATAPFIVMGLASARRHDLRRWLAHPRLADDGPNAVLVDLTHAARAALAYDWEREFSALLSAMDDACGLRRPPVVVFCEDVFAMRRAEGALRSHTSTAYPGRAWPQRCGALLPGAGLLEAIGTPRPAPELPPIEFEADFKDATLVPLRQRLLSLARRLGGAGHLPEAAAVTTALRFLRACACSPIGCAEARRVASVLFDGVGDDTVRAAFFASTALQPMAKAADEAPEFAAEVRELLDDIKARVGSWEAATPISLKLEHLLLHGQLWNAADVLIVLADARMADVFSVSDLGTACVCEITDAKRFAARAMARPWRRMIVLRPEPRALRVLFTMQCQPERILLLGDAAGTALLRAEIAPLAALSEFERFAGRAAALSKALSAGGADEKIDLAEADFRYHVAPAEKTIDLTGSSDHYCGAVIRLRLESGDSVLYREKGHVLTFTPDEVRPFKRTAARDVRIGDRILVLRHDLRERLSDALARTRKATTQLRQYHTAVSRFRARLDGQTPAARAREALAAMQRIDPSIGEHELSNIRRWLSVGPSDEPQPPCAARDRHRFSVFMKAAEITEPLAQAYWELAILPSRTYRAQEGHLFNRRAVQFMLDPESVAASAGCLEFDGLWQAVADAVETVVSKELQHV